MASDSDEEARLRAVALQNAQSILVARRRAEEALRQQSEWLRITLASIGDAVITTDADGRVTSMNAVAQALTGWSQTDALGHFLTDVFQIVHEETRQPVDNPAIRALQTGTIIRLANHTVLLARTGEEHPIDDSAAPIRDESGATVGAVLVFRDVSERKPPTSRGRIWPLSSNPQRTPSSARRFRASSFPGTKALSACSDTPPMRPSGSRSRC